MRIVLLFFFAFGLGHCWSIDTKKNFLLLDQLLFSNLDSARRVLLVIDGDKKQLSTAENGELGAKWGVFYALSGNNTEALAAFWRAYSFTNNTVNSP